MTDLSTRVPGPPSGAPQDPGQARRWSPLVAWLGGLVVGTWLFHALGNGPLAAPPLDPAGWSAWLEDRDALIASIAVLRLVVLALSWYLVGATTIGIVARLARAARLVRIADTLTVPFVRRLLQTTLGVSLATAMIASAVPAGSVQAPVEGSSVTLSATPVEEDHADPGRGAQVELRAVAAGPDDEVTLERVPPTARPRPLELLERAREQARAAAGEGVVEPPVGSGGDDVGGQRADEYVVVAGDSLWSIAEAMLAGDDHARPEDEVVADYWRAVIEANRDSLTDPENPDLIFPGQIVRLPELPA